MVLAAGLSSRMRPLTNGTPKPLVQLAGRALIDHVLDGLAAADIGQVIVNVHYFAEQIERHLQDRAQPRILISDERDRLLDTGGAVKRALPLLGAAAFIVHNSDAVWLDGAESNLECMLAAWDGGRMDALLMLAGVDGSIGYQGRGDFALDGDGRLSRRKEDPVSYVFTGISIAHPRLFDDSPDGAFSLNRLWDDAIGKGRLYGVVNGGIWMHIGTPQALLEAEKRLKLG